MADEENKTKADLDLDTLSQGAKKVKLNGEIIEVYPVELGELFELTKLAQGFKKSDDMSNDDAIESFKKLREQFNKLIPGLDGKKLNIDQLFLLLDLIVGMALPSDLKELEKKGVTLSPTQKKMLSQLQKKLGDSSTSTPATPSN